MNFKKKAFYQDTFTSLSLENETIEGIEFEECEFHKCSFVNCTFDGCKFLDCKVIECRFSADRLPHCRFIEVKLLNSQLIGIDWTKADALEGLEFIGCKLNYSNFRMLKPPRLTMIKCEVKEADFVETDLSGGVFTGTDFENTKFFKTNLAGADFKGAKNYLIDARINTLKKTKFSMPEALSLLNGLDIIIE
ncbi:MAG: pentapeptide repeat-containing protein [Dehalogenimonas sp.]